MEGSLPNAGGLDCHRDFGLVVRADIPLPKPGNRVLDRQIESQSAGGRFRALSMRTVVREGAGQDPLDVALGHIPGTALPGRLGIPVSPAIAARCFAICARSRKTT
jgi:hypothetical protein